jgi:phage shock protein C
MNTPTSTPPPPPTDGNQTTSRSLHRPTHNRMIAGVAAGLADYLSVDVTIVRITIAVLAVFGGAGIALYIAGWLLMPNEGEERSIAQKVTHSKPICSN